jgi:hypothetical protein
MSNILRRPMFRRGGQAGGITTGLGRQGYSQGTLAKVQSQLNLINQLSPQRGGSNLNDFLINFGLNMVGNPPSGNIFQTAASEAQRPFAQFQQAESQERAGERKLISDIVQGLSDDEKIALQEQIDYLVKEFNISEEEALNRLKPTFRKDQSPQETARETLEAQIADLTKSVGQGGPGWSYDTALKIAQASQNKPEGKEYDTQNIAMEEEDVSTGLGSVDEVTGVITIAEPQGDYIEGFTYYNYIKDKWYTYNQNQFIPIE